MGGPLARPPERRLQPIPKHGRDFNAAHKWEQLGNGAKPGKMGENRGKKAKV